MSYFDGYAWTGRIWNFKYYVELQQYHVYGGADDEPDGSPGGRTCTAGAGGI